MRKEEPTIAGLLKAQGYATGQFGKNHLGDRDEHLPTNHGFDEFFGNLYHLNAEEEPENEDYPGENTSQAMKLALMDDEALIRRTAVESIATTNSKENTKLIVPLLYDPVKAVRIEAARRLAEAPDKHLAPDQKMIFKADLEEYITSMEFSADFSFGRYNLGNLYAAMNQPGEAIRNYLAAIKIDNLFYPAKVNLAMLYNRKGKNEKAEQILLKTLEIDPNNMEYLYALVDFYLKRKKFQKAKHMAQQMVLKHPNEPIGKELLGIIMRNLPTANP